MPYPTQEQIDEFLKAEEELAEAQDALERLQSRLDSSAREILTEWLEVQGKSKDLPQPSTYYSMRFRCIGEKTCTICRFLHHDAEFDGPYFEIPTQFVVSEEYREQERVKAQQREAQRLQQAENRKRKQAEEQEQADRETYERLKRKFEGGE